MDAVASNNMRQNKCYSTAMAQLRLSYLITSFSFSIDNYVKGPYPHMSLWASLSANFAGLGEGPVFQITKSV